MASRDEWRCQEALARLLDRWVDPATTWWTGVDTVCNSAFVGAMRKKRGVKAGTPDVLVLHRGQFIGIELKSKIGKASDSQRAARELILAAGGSWWMARSPAGAMVALHRSGVRFRTIRTHPYAEPEHWRLPNLELWEEPVPDPAEKRPRAPRGGELARKYAAAMPPISRPKPAEQAANGVGVGEPTGEWWDGLPRKAVPAIPKSRERRRAEITAAVRVANAFRVIGRRAPRQIM